MSRVQSLVVDDGDDGIRLDRWFKRHFPELSHGRLERLLRTGQIRVAGARALNLLKNKALKESLFRINSDGFKGPEIDSTHALIRILALGDSTTFGLGSVDYPSSLQTHFNS